MKNTFAPFSLASQAMKMVDPAAWRNMPAHTAEAFQKAASSAWLVKHPILSICATNLAASATMVSWLSLCFSPDHVAELSAASEVDQLSAFVLGFIGMSVASVPLWRIALQKAQEDLAKVTVIAEPEKMGEAMQELLAIPAVMKYLEDVRANGRQLMTVDLDCMNQIANWARTFGLAKAA